MILCRQREKSKQTARRRQVKCLNKLADGVIINAKCGLNMTQKGDVTIEGNEPQIRRKSIGILSTSWREFFSEKLKKYSTWFETVLWAVFASL